MADILSDDKRQEANAALLKIDKGLRSSRPGDVDQAETIAKFPSLVDSYPFPTLINVLFLKLADVFRTGSNLLRLNILKVVQLREKHLGKITSVGEFFKRIYSVMHSNDPIARAITLRMFGAMASLLSEKKTVHHSIQNSLESHDRVEVEAALFATDAFCEQSSVFVEGVYVKIADMVLGLKTPPDMKLKAILVFRKMHHSLTIASQVRGVCLKMLESHPTLTFVSVVLPTLTQLSIATVVQTSQQVELLLGYAEQDVRKTVRHLALMGLYRLSVQTPQCWEGKHIEKLVHLIENSKLREEKEVGCCVLYHLSSSIAVQCMVLLEDTIKPFCYEVCCTVARAYATACCCNIVKCINSSSSVKSSNDESAMEVEGDIGRVEEKVKVLVLLVVDILVTGQFDNCSSKSIKVLLGCIGDVVNSLVVQEELVVTLLSQLHKLPADCYSVLCTTVAAMERNWREEGDRVGVEAVTHHLLQILQNQQHESNPLLLPVGRMLVELHSGVYSSGRYAVFTSGVQPLLLKCVWDSTDRNRFWIAYRIARRGTKRGFHRMSVKIYKVLHQKVNEPKFKKWLQTLEQFSQAQCVIADAEGDPNLLVGSLQTASSYLYDCTLLVKGATPPSTLPLQFLPCLAALLDLYSQLLSLCIRYRSLYPPPLAAQGVPLSKFRELAGQFHSTSKRFSALLHSLFDADPHTLRYIQLLQQSCDLMSNIISTFISPQKPILSPVHPVPSTPVLQSVPVSLETTDSFDTRHTLGEVCNKVLSRAQSAAVKLQLLSASAEHLNVIEESALCLLDVPFLLPPSFFLSYQSTSVQLALTPPQSESVVLGNFFALKVEGVVDHYGKRIYRSPTSVLIRVKPHVDKLFDSSFKLPVLQELEETASVKNDYFIAEFLLTLPVAGQYVLQIENNLVDHEGRIWHTGPSVDMNVIVDTSEKLDIIAQQQRKAKSLSLEGSGSSGAVNGEHSSANSQIKPHW